MTLLFVFFSVLQPFSKKAVDHVQSHLAKKQVPPTLFQVRGLWTRWTNSPFSLFLLLIKQQETHEIWLFFFWIAHFLGKFITFIFWNPNLNQTTHPKIWYFLVAAQQWPVSLRLRAPIFITAELSHFIKYYWAMSYSALQREKHVCRWDETGQNVVCLPYSN